MDISILEDLGLTNAEIKVYISLLELGSSTAGRVIEKSGLQNSVVHRALNSLILKGIINYIFESERKIYSATDPVNFFNFIDDKKKRFEQILPDLKRKQKQTKEINNAAVYRGIKGIDKIYNIIINSKGKEYLTFGGGKECEERMGGDWWEAIHTKRIASKISSRQVFDETVREFGNKLIKRPISKVRYLSKEFAQFQETVISGDLVAINVFSENPYGFLIKDSKVAEGYKKHFEILWKNARN